MLATMLPAMMLGLSRRCPGLAPTNIVLVGIAMAIHTAVEIANPLFDVLPTNAGG